jgi:voltage-gated sodium channel
MKRILLNDKIILIAILINAILIFLLTFDTLSQNRILNALDYFFIVFFLLEILYKMKYYGIRSFFADGWNIFDFIIVLVSSVSLVALLIPIPHLSFILVFRTGRLFRFFRLIRFVPDIENLLSGISRALKSSSIVLVGLLIYIFITSILSCYLFGDALPEYFGNPILSWYSMFKIFTMEGWYEIPDLISIKASPLLGVFARIYFVLIVLSGGILGLSLVIAVFVDEMTMDNTQDLEKAVARLETKINQLLENQKSLGRRE